MKMTTLIVSASLACLGAISSISCSNPLSTGRDAAISEARPGTGALTVTIADAGAGKAKTIVAAASDLPAIASFELSLSCAGQADRMATFAAGALTGSFKFMAPGTWKVAVKGKTADGLFVASGSADAIVAASASTTVTVALSYIPANPSNPGALSLALSFPRTIGIDSVEASIDGVAVSPAPRMTDSGDSDSRIVCEAAGITAASPLVRMRLKRGGVVLLTWAERIWVYWNITTSNSSTLDASSFNSAPPAPASLDAALQVDNSIVLRWPNVGTAETYKLERSDNAGGSYTVIGASIAGGTTSFTDSLTASSTSYAYRIIADNLFGASGYASTGSATLTATDTALVAAEKTALAIGYGSGQNATSVTLDLSLPAAGPSGAAISWSSDNPAVSSSGAITRPSYTAGDASVTLTATITRGTASDTKAFTLTVPKLAQTPVEKLAADKAALVDGSIRGMNAALSAVSADLVLPTSGANGSTISWSSDSPTVVANDGRVTRPNGSDAVVTMRATITLSGSTLTKDFAMTVLATGSGGISVSSPAAPAPAGIVFRDALDAAISGFTVIKGSPFTVNTAFAGSSYAWHLDNSTSTVSAAQTCIVDPASLGLGAHSLLLDVLSGGKYYSGRIDFTVKYETVYAIGETGPGGGIVFYDKGSRSDGWRYLEAAPADLPDQHEWNNDFMTAGTTGTAGTGIGTGSANTAAMNLDAGTASLHPAAAACRSYSGGGKSDWFLPSKDELSAMYSGLGDTPEKRAANGFGDYGSYWSSSQNNAGFAWYFDFSRALPSTDMKFFGYSVRPVRAF